jgi:5-oxoprolinase (ATP-hydrolysing) subunit A
VIFLNLDAGEYRDEPVELWQQGDILCAACGGHAGDADSMSRVAAFCATSGTRLGVHPSYPDREGFGRRALLIEHDELARSIVEQCAALAAVASRHGVRVGWVKPHGALYHAAAADPVLARYVIDAAILALGMDIAIIGPPIGALHDAAAARGLQYLREAFADRRTRPDGTLVPRSEPDALITDPAQCAARAKALAPTADTICVHADTPSSLEIASAVRKALHEM